MNFPLLALLLFLLCFASSNRQLRTVPMRSIVGTSRRPPAISRKVGFFVLFLFIAIPTHAHTFEMIFIHQSSCSCVHTRVAVAVLTYAGMHS